LCGDPTSEGRLVDVIDERAVAVDLDYRQLLAEAPLERRIAPDVDPHELERDLRPHALEHLAPAVAEVAALRVVQDDPGRGYG